MLSAIDISTSGLVAQRQRLNTIAGNIANANTTRDADGNTNPYQRRFVTFAAAGSDPGSAKDGVGVTFQVETDTETPLRTMYEPGHPDADANGYVKYPNVSSIDEFVNAVEASRAYQANIAAIEISKEMSQLGLRILA